MLMKFNEPVKGVRISSLFGMRVHPVLKTKKLHEGVDYAAVTGTPVYAVAPGIVDHAGSDAVNGNLLRIKHAEGLTSHYAHNSKLLVKRGEKVIAGQHIANVGSTGRATGAHLHFAIKRNGRFIDPLPALRDGIEVNNSVAEFVAENPGTVGGGALAVLLLTVFIGWSFLR